MSICEGCAQTGHGPEECANWDLPMCARTCTCRHGVPEPDPAPYWSAVSASAESAASPEGQG